MRQTFLSWMNNTYNTAKLNMRSNWCLDRLVKYKKYKNKSETLWSL